MSYVVPDLLDKIKAKYEDDRDKPISMYKLVLQSYFGDSPVCSIKEEHVLEYDYLCARMFDLDVTGWEVMNVEDSSECFDISQNDTIGFILVTITLARVEKGK